MNWGLLQNSLMVGVLTTVASVAIGFVTALWMLGLPERLRTVVFGAAIVALALPPFLVTNCWLHFLGRTGVWHSWLPVSIFSTGGTIWILTLLFWPLSLLLVWGAWQRLQASHIESDPLVKGWALIRVLLFPLARSALGQAALIVLVLALNNFAVPAILQVKVFPAEMWVRFNTTFDTWGTLRQSWPLVLAPIMLLCWFATREVPWPRRQGPISGLVFRRQLGRRWFCASGACSLLFVFCSVFLPLYQILSLPRTWTELPGALAAGQSALWNSFIYAGISASLIIGLCVWAMSRSQCVAIKNAGTGARGDRAGNVPQPMRAEPWLRLRLKGGPIVSGLAWLAFLLPGVLLGIGLIHAFNHNWTAAFYQSAGIVILAYAIRYLALGLHSLKHAGRSVDPTLVDVARLEGARRWQMLRHVLWPQIARTVTVAWYVVFLFCLWDVESIVLVVPPGGETLALRIFNLLHYGHNAQVNALCFLLLLVGLTPLVLSLAVGFLRRFVRGRAKPPGFEYPPKEGLPGSTYGNMLQSRLPSPPPEGTAESACILQPSLTGLLPLWGADPKAEALGYCQMSLRDKSVPSSGVAVPRSNHRGGRALDRDFISGTDTKSVLRSQPRLICLQHVLKSKNPGAIAREQGHSVWLDAHGSGIAPALLACVLALAQTSCSPSGGRSDIQSKLFQRVQIIGSRGVGVGQLNKPRSIAIDATDNLYVVDMTGRVQKFSPDGVFVLSWQMPEIERGKPKGMCRDPQGNVLVVEPHYSRVNIFSPLGKLLAQWGSHGTNNGELSLPRGVAVNSRGDIFVSEYEEAERVQTYRFDPAEPSGGKGLRKPKWIGGFGHAGTAPGEFNRPEGLCVDAQDRLYVADSCNHRIQVFAIDGKFLRAYGKPGKGLGELSYPYDICVDKAGRQYVCEFGNSRIQVFDAEDRPIEIIGGAGAEPGRFSNPWGVALDSAGNLYVADSQNHRVQKLVRKQ